MKSSNLITPEEARKRQESSIPAIVFDVFNELIAEHFDEHGITFEEQEAVKRICSRSDIKEDDLYARRWLDVEPIYRKAGWIVTYNKPGYCEDYEATFTFRPEPKK